MLYLLVDIDVMCAPVVYIAEGADTRSIHVANDRGIGVCRVTGYRGLCVCPRSQGTRRAIVTDYNL